MQGYIGKITSRGDSTPGVEDAPQARSDITPSTSNDVNNTHTIPTHQPVPSVAESPVDRSNTSPGSPPETPPSNPSSGQDLAEPLPEQNKTTEKGELPRWLAQGITGSDVALPLFDGTSKNKDDHFIDLATASMESAPDVRVYFWIIGFHTHVPEDPDIPSDLETRKVFDAKLVREGREYLKDVRSRGSGMFMSSERDILVHNEPGSTWYRTPTSAICEAWSSFDLKIRLAHLPLKDESCYTDEAFEVVPYVLTNLRVPLWWVETFKDGVRPGTEGWDDAIIQAYTDLYHPGQAIYSGFERDDIIYRLCLNADDAGRPGMSGEILDRDWPDVGERLAVTHDYVEPDYLGLQGITAAQFLGTA